MLGFSIHTVLRSHDRLSIPLDFGWENKKCNFYRKSHWFWLLFLFHARVRVSASFFPASIDEHLIDCYLCVALVVWWWWRWWWHNWNDGKHFISLTHRAVCDVSNANKWGNTNSAELHNCLVFALMFTFRQIMKEIVQQQQQQQQEIITTNTANTILSLFLHFLVNQFVLIHIDVVLKEAQKTETGMCWHVFVCFGARECRHCAIIQVIFEPRRKVSNTAK